MLIRLSNNDDDFSYLAKVEQSAARKFTEYFGNDTSDIGRTLGSEILINAHQNKSLWIAAEKEDIVGFLAATTIDNALHIQEVSVAFEHQGKSIGRALLEAVTLETKNRQYPYVSLTTDRTIPWNKKFYERVGFKEISLNECLPGLSRILIHDKKHSPVPEDRIAMVLTVNF